MLRELPPKPRSQVYEYAVQNVAGLNPSMIPPALKIYQMIAGGGTIISVANPVGIAVAGVAALGAGGTGLYTMGKMRCASDPDVFASGMEWNMVSQTFVTKFRQ
jgi:hypothetical protein